MPQFIPLFRKPLNTLGRAFSQQVEKNALQLSRQTLQQFKASEQGVTLLECLVAISVIAILGAMIGPPLVFTAATRLQNQRAEQAFQIAQAEVDRIRTIVARGEHEPANLPLVVAALDDAPIPNDVSDVIRSIRADCNTYTGQQIPLNQLLQVDITGDPDCEADFLMQVYRTDGAAAPSDSQNRPLEFSVGVRVYSARAGDEGVLENLSDRPANLSFAAGQGDLDRDSGQTGPLAIFGSDVIWSDRSDALCNYRGNPDC